MKILSKLLIGIGWMIILLVIFVTVTWEKKFNAPYPDIKASTDTAIIARGKYLAFGPMHCATCHVPMNSVPEIDAGKVLPMIGGWEYEIPPGIFRSTNLTPDPETGIGNLKDEEIARALRYAVGHDGRYLAPFMPYQEVSDDDLIALISYLRSQPPVKHNLNKTEFTFLGKSLFSFGILKPDEPREKVPKSVVRDSTTEYGKYLVNNLANCKGCHTNRSMKTGKLIGPIMAGGRLFEPNQYSNGFSFVPPNITPDPETGVMNTWSEETFIKRFRKGRVYKGSPMFWGPYSRMEETDLKAIYKYLQTIDPVKRKVEKTVYKPGDKLPQIK